MGNPNRTANWQGRVSAILNRCIPTTSSVGSAKLDPGPSAADGGAASHKTQTRSRRLGFVVLAAGYAIGQSVWMATTAAINWFGEAGFGTIRRVSGQFVHLLEETGLSKELIVPAAKAMAYGTGAAEMTIAILFGAAAVWGRQRVLLLGIAGALQVGLFSGFLAVCQAFKGVKGLPEWVQQHNLTVAALIATAVAMTLAQLATPRRER